jgi:hypothetical protein
MLGNKHPTTFPADSARTERDRRDAQRDLQTSAALCEETALVGELLWEILVNNIIEASFGKRLLLGANPHLSSTGGRAR